MFEVITKRKVSKHLKKGTMAGSFTYIFNITGTDTLLAGSHTCSRRDLCSCKIWFQRSHTCIDQQKALIILRYKRKTVHNQMSFALEKVQKHLTKFIYSILFHCSFLLIVKIHQTKFHSITLIQVVQFIIRKSF